MAENHRTSRHANDKAFSRLIISVTVYGQTLFNQAQTLLIVPVVLKWSPIYKLNKFVVAQLR